MNWFPRATLITRPNERLVWLYPEDSTGEQARDSLVEGHILLTLPRPTLVREVTIAFVGEAIVTSDARGSRGKVFETFKTLYRPLQDETLEAGQHRFDYSIAVPATLPSSLLLDSFGSITYQLTVQAAGLKDVSSISLISSVIGRGRPPPVLDLHGEDVNELGAFRIDWLSSRFTCGSLIEVRAHIVELAKDVKIVGASLSVVEHTVIRHFDAEGQLEQESIRQSQEHCISRFDTHLDLSVGDIKRTNFPVDVATGQAFKLQHYARMPSAMVHRGAQPATHSTDRPGSQSPIAHRHELIFRLDYDTAERQRQIVFRRAVAYGSHLLIDENVVLPDYATQSEAPTSRPRAFNYAKDWGARDTERCACSKPFDELLAEHLSRQEAGEESKSYKVVSEAERDDLARQ